MSILRPNKTFLFQQDFYLPQAQAISQRLQEEDSAFYKSFRIKTPAKNIKIKLNTSQSAKNWQKEYSYANYIIESNKKLSFNRKY